MPGGILEHCLSDKSQWSDLGLLTNIAANETIMEQSKEIWREFKTSLLQEAPQRLQRYLSSPRISETKKNPNHFFRAIDLSTTSSDRCQSPDKSSRKSLLTLSDPNGEIRSRSFSSPSPLLFFLEQNLLELDEQSTSQCSSISPI